MVNQSSNDMKYFCEELCCRLFCTKHSCRYNIACLVKENIAVAREQTVVMRSTRAEWRNWHDLLWYKGQGRIRWLTEFRLAAMIRPLASLIDPSRTGVHPYFGIYLTSRMTNCEVRMNPMWVTGSDLQCHTKPIKLQCMSQLQNCTNCSLGEIPDRPRCIIS